MIMMGRFYEWGLYSPPVGHRGAGISIAVGIICHGVTYAKEAWKSNAHHDMVNEHGIICTPRASPCRRIEELSLQRPAKPYEQSEAKRDKRAAWVRPTRFRGSAISPCAAPWPTWPAPHVRAPRPCSPASGTGHAKLPEATEWGYVPTRAP